MRKTLVEEWEEVGKAVRDFKGEIEKAVLGGRDIKWFFILSWIAIGMAGALFWVLEK